MAIQYPALPRWERWRWRCRSRPRHRREAIRSWAHCRSGTRRRPGRGSSSRGRSGCGRLKRSGRPSAPAPRSSGRSPKVVDMTVRRHHPVPVAVGIGHDHLGRTAATADAGARSLELGISEREHPTVGGHHEVAAPVDRRDHPDDRRIQPGQRIPSRRGRCRSRGSNRRTRRRRRRRSHRRRPPASSPGDPGWA